MEKKTNISFEELCGKQLREITVYIDQVRSLRFEDKSDYSYQRKIFQSLFVRQGFEYGNVFDWIMKRYAEQQEIQPRAPPKETVSGP
jgi:casein kinase I family protein HRR25